MRPGTCPPAVRNYLALLGWGYDESTTFFTTDELIERFSLERVSKNPAVFDEQKLAWMNANYLRGLEIDELVRLLEERYDRDDLREAAEIAQEKLRTIEDFWPFAGFLFERREIDPAAWEKVMKDGAADNLEQARAALAELPRLGQGGDRGGPAARRRGARRSSRRRSSSRFGSRSRARPCRPGSSSRWPSWGARKRSCASMLHWIWPEKRLNRAKSKLGLNHSSSCADRGTVWHPPPPQPRPSRRPPRRPPQRLPRSAPTGVSRRRAAVATTRATAAGSPPPSRRSRRSRRSPSRATAC